MRRLLALLLFGCLMTLVPRADSAPPQVTPMIIDVWPSLAPGETTRETGTSETTGGVTRLTDITQPRLLLYPAAGKGPHPAVMVCPGGAYSILAIDLEGTEIAHWLNGLGFTVAVLQYRVPNKREGAFQDGQQALSLLRSRARELGIEPHHLGVLGFSAGGHLCARLACATEPRDARPDFAGLIYPAYLLDAAGVPAPEVKPHAGMPPLFLMQTQDDPYLDAPAYATALQDVGVPTTTAFMPTAATATACACPRNSPPTPGHPKPPPGSKSSAETQKNGHGRITFRTRFRLSVAYFSRWAGSCFCPATIAMKFLEVSIRAATLIFFLPFGV